MLASESSIQQFAAALKAAGKKSATVDAYCRDVRRFLDFSKAAEIDLNTVDPDYLVQFQRYLAEESQDRGNSIRRSTIGVRQFFRFLSEKNKQTESAFDQVTIPERLDILPPEHQLSQVGDMLETELLEQRDLKSARNALILALLGIEGLKTSEILQLKWQDCLITPSHASLSVATTRARTIELHEKTAEVLRRYKKLFFESDYPSMLEGMAAKLVISFKGRDAAVPLPQMSRHGLKFVLYEIGQKYDLKHLNSELLRHHALSFQLDLGKDPEDLMKHLGLKRMGNIKLHLAHRILS